MNDEAMARWRYFVDELLDSAGDSGSLPASVRDELFELQWSLQREVFGGIDPIDPTDARLRIVLDALAALSVAEQDDPSHPWARADLLDRAGRHLEAADDFLVAAVRFEREAATRSGQTGDEEEWAQSALGHAARNLALGGQPVSAAALLHRLTPGARLEVEPLIRRAAVAR